jgi:hypothetical protein
MNKNIHKKKTYKHTHTLSLYFFLFFFFPCLQNTNFKNSKLNKYYIKQFKNYKTTIQKIHNSVGTSSVKPKDSKNSGGASSHAPPSLAARGFKRRREKGRKTGGSGSASFPFPVLAGVTCKKQKNAHSSRFHFVFCFFRSVSVFSFSDLLHRRSFFGFTSSSPSLQVGVLLVWDGVCGGGAGRGRRCCTESGPSLLVEEGGQLWRMRKGRRLWALLRLTEGSLSGVGGVAASES